MYKYVLTKMEEISVMGENVYKSRTFSGFQILNKVANYLLSEDKNSIKRFIVLLNNDLEFLLFLMSQISTVVDKVLIYLSAILWYYHFGMKNVPVVKKTWKKEFENVDFGRTARNVLIIAVRSKCIPIIQFVMRQCQMENYVDVPEDPEMLTFFLYAVEQGDIEVVKVILREVPQHLLDLMINVRRTPDDIIALHMAAECGNLAMVKLLCEYGAKYNIFVKKRMTANDKSYKFTEVRNFFEILKKMFAAAKGEISIDFQQFYSPEEGCVAYWHTKDYRSGFTAEDFVNKQV